MSSTIVPTTTFTAPVVTIQGEREGMEVTIPAEAATLEGFRNWAKSDAFPEHGRFSFIEGEVVADMSPENFENHNSLKTSLTASLFYLVQQKNLGLLFSDRYLFTNELAGISTEPDAMFLSRHSLRQGLAKLVQSSSSPDTHIELIGSPDWVLEVVSPSSIRKDKEVLRKGYYRAGVSEYWIVDARGKELDFLMLVRGPRSFTEVKPIDDWRTSPTFGAACKITRASDEDGFWQYTLHTKNNS